MPNQIETLKSIINNIKEGIKEFNKEVRFFKNNQRSFEEDFLFSLLLQKQASVFSAFLEWEEELNFNGELAIVNDLRELTSFLISEYFERGKAEVINEGICRGVLREIKESDENLIKEKERSDEFSKKISELETELAGERDAHQNILPTQFHIYGTQFKEQFAKLAEHWGGEKEITVDNWIPDLIEFLWWKWHKAENEKEPIKAQLERYKNEKNKLETKYQNQIQNLKKLNNKKNL